MSSLWAHRNHAALLTMLVVSCALHAPAVSAAVTVALTTTETSHALEVDATGMDSNLHALHVSAYAQHTVAFHSGSYHS